MFKNRAVLTVCLLFVWSSCSEAAELVTPTEDAPRYQLSNFRTEEGSRGRIVIKFDFKRTQQGNKSVLFIKGKTASGLLSVAATLPSWNDSGTMQLESWGGPGGKTKIDLELYVAQIHTVGEKKYVYSMVSNAIRLGNPGEPTKPRAWTAEEKAGYQEYLRNKPKQIKRYEVTTAVPANAVKVPNTAKLTKGIKLQACYQSKWSPITTLEENSDGSVHVRWDKWGAKYDCNMLRSELIIDKTVLARLDKHPQSHFPDTPPSVANSASTPKTASTAAATGKPRKSYPVSIEVPSDSQLVPADAKLPAGTALQACYAGKWNPITHLSHNDDGTLTVRWDDYGPTYDCSMVREQLIIKKAVLAGLVNTPVPLESRTWTDVTGKFKVKAKLVRQSATHVTLLTEAGKEVTLPLTKLSRADQDFLAGATSDLANPFE